MSILNSFFECDGEIQGDAGELDGQTGAASDVEIGKLTKGVLEFEDAHEFRVQSEDAGATRFAWGGQIPSWVRRKRGRGTY